MLLKKYQRAACVAKCTWGKILIAEPGIPSEEDLG